MTIKTTENSTGRATTNLLSNLRSLIYSGEISVGEMLPSVRELSDKYHLAPKTVHKALKEIAAEGLALAEPRKGYRVQPRSNDPRKGCPVALVLDSTDLTNVDSLHFRLRMMMERILADRSCPILSVFSVDRKLDDVIEQIKMGRSWGVLLDTVNVDLLNRVKDTGIPAVMMDAWVEDAPFDVILQDNYQGGFKAGMHLIKKGYRKIAWVGPIKATGISRERFGGAASALAAEGLPLLPEMCYECDVYHSEKVVHDLLTSKNRPDAIISMWQEISVSIAHESKKLNLKIGADFDMVGWSTEDQYPSYEQAFDQKYIPPAIIWNPAEMAETAISRLTERWEKPQLPLLRLHIGTKLKQHSTEKNA